MQQDQIEANEVKGASDDVVEEDEDFEGDESDSGEEEEDAALEEEDDGDQASLEELLAQRAAVRRGSDDADDSDDIMSLSSEPQEPIIENVAPRVTPVKDTEEFVCKSCHLVKPRVQLADPEKGYCRDCV